VAGHDSTQHNYLKSSVKSPKLKRNIDKLQKELILNIKDQINTKTKKVYSHCYKTENRSLSEIEKVESGNKKKTVHELCLSTC